MPGRLSLRGALVAALVLAALTTAGPASAATFVVTNTDDVGPGSLRAAITAANATGASDTIKFNIPGAGGHVITLASALPPITQPVVINGQTQPGFAGEPLVELHNGTGSASTTGLDVKAGPTKVLGLAVTGFGAGLLLEGSGGDTVSGCWVGLDLSGTAVGNALGVDIETGSGNVVGGTSTGARNVISGNTSRGVSLAAGASSNVVDGNFVGTDPTGALARANGEGIRVFGASNTIGGTSVSTRNVISENVNSGVTLDGSLATGNAIEGNFIGLAKSGKTRLGNTFGIVVTTGASANTIGGPSAGARNVVSANKLTGIDIVKSSGNAVEGNYIGTDVAGLLALGNGQNGVLIVGGPSSLGGNVIGGTTAGAGNLISGQHADPGIGLVSTDGNVVQANFIGVDSTGNRPLRNRTGIQILSGSGNQIGGSEAGSGNLISGNFGAGIVQFNGATGTKIEGNLVGPAATGGALLGNGGAGVEISASGNSIGPGNTIAGNIAQGVLVDTGTRNRISNNSISLNDQGISLVNGGNAGQPRPTIASVTTASGMTTIHVTLSAKPQTLYSFEVFSNEPCDPSAPPEGKTFLIGKSVITNPAGNISFNLSVAAVDQGLGVTATATEKTPGNTSEFSDCVEAP